MQGFHRKYLRGLANPIKPQVFIGKSGLSDNVAAALDEALEAQELVKVKFLEFKDEKQDLAEQLEKKCRCDCVGIVGHVAIFYRQQNDPKKRTIKLPQKEQSK